jgi:hypothetical protein
VPSRYLEFSCEYLRIGNYPKDLISMFTSVAVVPQFAPPEPFVEADEAARFLHYSVRSIMQMARAGKIPGTRLAMVTGRDGFFSSANLLNSFVAR